MLNREFRVYFGLNEILRQRSAIQEIKSIWSGDVVWSVGWLVAGLVSWWSWLVGWLVGETD